MSNSKVNPNLLAVLGVILITIGAVGYIILPQGSDRGVILVAVVPIATTLLAGGVVGGRLDNQTADLKEQTATIIKQTNGHLSAKTDEIAKAAVRAVHAENASKTETEPRRTRKDTDNG